MILLMADGESNRTIGELVDLHYNQVGIWRKRYEEFGLAGLEDEERPGRPVVYDHDDVLLLVKLVTEEPPEGATRWTMEALAQAMADHGVAISASQAWRICKSLDLKPWQVESWMTSHDPDFWAKASDVCGLYLDPPTNAVVWSVDEKSGMQAKSRVNPTKPAGSHVQIPDRR
jgi:transposase